MTSLELAQKAVAILDNKKVDEPEVLGIRELSVLVGYSVLATGASSMHVKVLTDESEFQLKGAGTTPDRVGEYRSNSWILLDHGHVVIYVLTAEARRFYDLDRLWQGAGNVEPNFLSKAE